MLLHLNSLWPSGVPRKPHSVNMHKGRTFLVTRNRKGLSDSGPNTVVSLFRSLQIVAERSRHLAFEWKSDL